MADHAFRLPPTTARRRGLPAIGVELVAPPEVEIMPVGEGSAIVRCRELGADGRTLGELEVRVVPAALIIDRDGILEETARDVAIDTTRVAVPNVAAGMAPGTVAVALPNASGYRADVTLRGTQLPALPYLHVFAMAPNDPGIDGCIVIVVRSAQPEWAAAEAMLASLRILPRHTAANTNEPVSVGLPWLPPAGKR